MKILTAVLVAWVAIWPNNSFFPAGALVALEISLFIASRRQLVKEPGHWSAREQKLMQKYHFFLRSPITSMKFSSLLSLIQLLSIPLAVVLAARGFYAGAVIAALNYFIAGRLAFRLNPIPFLKDAAQKHTDDPSLLDDWATLTNLAEEKHKQSSVRPRP